jgi:hypothetical protein
MIPLSEGLFAQLTTFAYRVLDCIGNPVMGRLNKYRLIVIVALCLDIWAACGVPTQWQIERGALADMIISF